MARQSSGGKQNKEWTAARRHSFIVSVLRGGTQRYPPKYETLNEAKTEKKVNTSSGRLAQHYACAVCRGDFPATMVQVDHIQPAVGPDGFSTWDSFIDGLYCGKVNLQVLCKPCHSIKTQDEKLKRKK